MRTCVRMCAFVRLQDAVLLGRGAAFIGCFASCYARMAFNLMVSHNQYYTALQGRTAIMAYIRVILMMPYS